MNYPTQPLPLLPVAQKALEVDPITVLRQWAGQLAPPTRRKYAGAMRRLVKWSTGAVMGDEDAAMCVMRIVLDAGGRAPCRQLLLGWRQSMTDEGLAPSSIAGALSSVCSVIQALSDSGLIDFEVRRISPKPEPREDRSSPPRAEVQKLLYSVADEARNGCHRAIRDLAILQLLHSAAMRRMEVLQLTVGNVGLGADAYIITRRKGHREPTKSLIGEACADALRPWLALRREHGATDADPVFVSLHGGPSNKQLSFEAARKMLKRRAKDCGTESDFRMHGLRKAASTWAAAHASLATLREVGQWANMPPACYLSDRDERRREALALVEIRA